MARVGRDVSDVGSESIRSRINQDEPASPRVWNYWLGGKDNYEVDRLVGDHVIETTPQIVEVARSSRQFLIRAITYVTREAGVRQFLDIGTGLPTANNTHEIAQRVAPESKIVYVDNDPIVLAHARALLISTPEGETRYLDADLYEPVSIIEQAKATLDFSQPIALVLMGILGHVPRWEQAKEITSTLLAALPPGSYLVSSDSSDAIDEDGMRTAVDIYNETANPKYNLRKPEVQAELYEGLELVEPGLVPCASWRPADGTDVVDVDHWGAVARKP